MTRYLREEICTRIQLSDLFLFPLAGKIRYLPWLLEELEIARGIGRRAVAVSFARVPWLLAWRLRPHDIEMVDGREDDAASRLFGLASAVDNPYR